jgi:hypothetical protein
MMLWTWWRVARADYFLRSLHLVHDAMVFVSGSRTSLLVNSRPSNLTTFSSKRV